ncbi:MAG: hypothetical protein AB9846_00775 [Tenuifilaceae bacterium]
MKNIATNSQQKSISRAFPISFSVTAQILLLIMVGFIATWLHLRFRIPLQMPGRHGLEFMMLIMGARALSTLRLSSTITVTGSILATLIPGLGYGDPLQPYIYLFMGATIDFSWYKWKNIWVWIPLAAILGGFVYSFIPIFRMFLSPLMGKVHLSLSNGLLYPWFTHFMFGFIGSLAGVGLISGLKKLRKK